jgi:hypothetical protein
VASLQHDLDVARARIDAPATPARAAAPARAPAPPPGPAAPPPPTVAPAAPPPPPPAASGQAAWDATAGSTLEREVTERFGQGLSPDQKKFLVATLARVRDASRRLNDTPVNPADPASIREHAAQREAIQQADQVFRKELGVGVSAFVQGLSGDKIEEAFPPDPAR